MRLLKEMQHAGYHVEPPADIEELKDRLLEGNRLIYGTDGNVAAHLSTEEYRKLFPACSGIEPFWGEAPAKSSPTVTDSTFSAAHSAISLSGSSPLSVTSATRCAC